MPRDPHDLPVTRHFARLFRRDPGASAALAAAQGIPEATVRHWWTERGARGIPMHADAIEDACDIVGDYSVPQGIIERAGGTVSWERAARSEGRDLRRTTAELMRDVGELSIALADAELDGNVDAVEASQLSALFDALMASAQAGKARLARVVVPLKRGA